VIPKLWAAFFLAFTVGVWLGYCMHARCKPQENPKVRETGNNCCWL